VILEKFYKGKIHPGEQVMPIDKERYRKETLFEDKRQRLLDRLDEPIKRECLYLFEEANALSACDCEQAYIEGMRMGARLAAELLFLNENK